MATWEKLMHQKHIYTISKMTAILTKIMPTLPLTGPTCQRERFDEMGVLIHF